MTPIVVALVNALLFTAIWTCFLLAKRRVQRWLSWRHRTPALVRNGVPRDGGRGVLAPEDKFYPYSGHLERAAPLVTRCRT